MQRENPIPPDLRKVRRDDLDQVARLMEAYRPYLLSLAEGGLTGDLRAKCAPSDLVQETLVAAYQDFTRFRGNEPAELRRWLEKILHTTLLDQVKRYRVAEKRALEREVPIDAPATEPIKETVTSESTDPQEAAIQHEETAKLIDGLRRVPEPYKTVLKLRHLQERSFPEIADATDRTVRVVRRQWAEGVRRWQSIVERN